VRAEKGEERGEHARKCVYLVLIYLQMRLLFIYKCAYLFMIALGLKNMVISSSPRTPLLLMRLHGEKRGE